MTDIVAAQPPEINVFPWKNCYSRRTLPTNIYTRDAILHYSCVTHRERITYKVQFQTVPFFLPNIGARLQPEPRGVTILNLRR